MPYRKAYLWVTLVVLLTIPAFWRGYFGQFTDAPWEMHFHAATATGWMILLATQAWAAHRKDRLALHRALGRASLFYFPLFMASAMVIVWSMAKATAVGDSMIYEAHGEGLGAYDLLSVLAVAWFFHEALKERRNVHVHARFMIGTLFMLLGPVLARLFAIPLFITLGGSYEPPVLFYAALAAAQLFIVAIALWLWRAAPVKGRRPMAIVALLVTAQLVLFSVARLSDAWRELFMAIGATSPAIWMALGCVIGALVAWRGWQAGKRRPHKDTAPGAVPAE